MNEELHRIQSITRHVNPSSVVRTKSVSLSELPTASAPPAEEEQPAAVVTVAASVESVHSVSNYWRRWQQRRKSSHAAAATTTTVPVGGPGRMMASAFSQEVSLAITLVFISLLFIVCQSVKLIADVYEYIHCR